MNREEALEIWAPAGSPWSRWAKAVLFGFMPEELPDAPSAVSPLWRAPFGQETALLVELAGADGVEFGVAAARSGYRPVPLYNACPYPAEVVGGTNVPAVIEVLPIMRALEREADALQGLPLPSSAPPAFLLDAHRHRLAFPPAAGWFDNRSIIREFDVPTAAFLQRHGIRQVILVQARSELGGDLRAVLLAWQDGGLTICRQVLAEPWNPQVFAVTRPHLLKSWWDKLMFCFYPRNAAGSFGKYVRPSSG